MCVGSTPAPIPIFTPLPQMEERAPRVLGLRVRIPNGVINLDGPQPVETFDRKPTNKKKLTVEGVFSRRSVVECDYSRPDFKAKGENVMGCDIHLYVEKQNDGKWENVTAPGSKIEQTDNDNGGYLETWDCDRNYSLFAILAGVRNGYGFAGCDTGNPVTPIDTPRGVPDDVCEVIKSQFELWDSDGHSASYLTLAELLSFDWTQNKTHRGYVDWESWKEWKRCRWIKAPKSYCGGVSGPNVVILSPEQAHDAVSCNQLFDPTKSIYVCDEWVTPYWYCCKQFWSEIIPQLLAIDEPKNVRIVFWFDN